MKLFSFGFVVLFVSKISSLYEKKNMKLDLIVLANLVVGWLFS